MTPTAITPIITPTPTNTLTTIPTLPPVDGTPVYISNTPTPTFDETTNWKTYTNKLSLYSLKYPSTWKVLDLSEGTQIEIYFQPDKTKPVGELLIEKISKVPGNISQFIDSKSIGGLTAKCMSDQTAIKTWCYLENNNNKISILIVNDKDLEYNKILEKILSTFKFTNTTTQYTCPTSGWVDCMPVLDEAKKLACSDEAMTWYKTNCPNFQGGAL